MKQDKVNKEVDFHHIYNNLMKTQRFLIYTISNYPRPLIRFYLIRTLSSLNTIGASSSIFCSITIAKSKINHSTTSIRTIASTIRIACTITRSWTSSRALLYTNSCFHGRIIVVARKVFRKIFLYCSNDVKSEKEENIYLFFPWQRQWQDHSGSFEEVK